LVAVGPSPGPQLVNNHPVAQARTAGKHRDIARLLIAPEIGPFFAI